MRASWHDEGMAGWVQSLLRPTAGLLPVRRACSVPLQHAGIARVRRQEQHHVHQRVRGGLRGRVPPHDWRMRQAARRCSSPDQTPAHTHACSPLACLHTRMLTPPSCNSPPPLSASAGRQRGIHHGMYRIIPKYPRSKYFTRPRKCFLCRNLNVHDPCSRPWDASLNAHFRLGSRACKLCE